MKNGKLGVAIVGCGNIATRYAEQTAAYERTAITGFYDVLTERSQGFADTYGGKAFPSLEAVLEDAETDLIVNLTIHHAHVEVVSRCLEAGKHVHTEKPIALDYNDALGLVERARTKGVRLSSAPITWMGEAQQTAWKIIREGRTGTIRLIYAEVNHGRIETWHPNPEPFYQVGPLWDVGIYPTTMLTAFFGPVKRVRAHRTTLFPDRVTNEGRPFRIETPDFHLAFLEFASGPVARLTANFYAKGSKQGGSLEFHGDLGRVYLGNFQRFDADVEFGEFGSDYEAVPYLKTPFEGIEFARAVEDVAAAIEEDRPQRATGMHAAHVVEVLQGIQTSAVQEQPVEITSEFDQPKPMDWAH